jgi:hypothetical protein
MLASLANEARGYKKKEEKKSEELGVWRNETWKPPNLSGEHWGC